MFKTKQKVYVSFIHLPVAKMEGLRMPGNCWGYFW